MLKKSISRFYYSMPVGCLIRRTVLQLFLFVVLIFNFLLNILPFHSYKRLICKIFAVRIGKNVVLCNNIRFLSIGNCSIGENSIINRDCVIDNRGTVIVDDNVSISTGVSLWTTGHNIDSNTFEQTFGAIHIKSHACIFANATILPGVVLGNGVVVFPCSVVYKSVEELNVVSGNPAIVLRKRMSAINYTISSQFWFA